MDIAYIIDNAVAQRTAELLNQNAFIGIEAKDVDVLLIESNSEQIRVIHNYQAQALQDVLNQLSKRS